MYIRKYVYKTGNLFTWKRVSIKVQFENEEEALKVKWRDLVIPTTDGWTKKKMKLHAIMEEAKLKEAAKADKIKKDCFAEHCTSKKCSYFSYFTKNKNQ